MITVIPTRRPDRPATLQSWLPILAYGLIARTLFGAKTPPLAMRARFERFARTSRQSLQHKFPQVRFEDHVLGRLHVEAVCASVEPRCAIIHLHGGAFVFGSAASYLHRAHRLSYRCAAEVFVPDYRLAPEHRFPAALDDALVAYQYVRALRPGMPIFVTGDSAGGGLALSLLLRLRELGECMPQGVIALSPWTDLSTSGESVDRNRDADRWLSRRHLESWSQHYAGSCDRREPLLSPVFAELHALPPLLLLAGEHEVLLDDALRVASRARLAGTQADVHIGRRMQHDWPLTLPWLEESRAAWDVMRKFIDTHMMRIR
jgi:monoterpene epsilon-lactone hydrolase